MKYDKKELQKALDLAKNVSELDISFDPKERLIISFTEPEGEIPHTVMLYPMRNEEASKFAEVIITKRL